MRAAMRVRSNCQETMRIPPQPKTKPVFSLIVCTLRRKDTLCRLFESLAMQTFQDFEVIVVDQNMPGFLDEVIDHYRPGFVIAHVTASPGLSAARNVGLDRATGDIIAFPDDDCWYDPKTLAKVLTRIGSEKSAAIVSGRTTDADGQSSVSLFLRHASQISRRNYLKCGNSNCLFFVARYSRKLDISTCAWGWVPTPDFTAAKRRMCCCARSMRDWLRNIFRI